MSLRTLTRLGAVPLALGAVVLGVAAPASAHVTISASTTAAGAFTVLTLSVPHGCDGSATTEIAIQIPEEINAVTPTRNALWEVDKQVEQLDPPVTDAHGNEITERVATVTYTAKSPLPDGYRDAFELSVQLPESEGTTLRLPDDPDVRGGRVGLDRGTRGGPERRGARAARSVGHHHGRRGRRARFGRAGRGRG